MKKTISEKAEAARFEIRAKAPEYLADRAASPLIPNIFGQMAASFGDDETEIDFIDAEEGKSMNSQEQRNRQARLDGEEFDQKRLAENAGIRAGRISLTGATEREKERAAASKRAAAKEDARTMHLLALQAQIDSLNARIAALGEQIADIEERYLDPDERARIAGMPQDEQYGATDAALRRRVANGEMPQSEYDKWKQAQREKAEFEKERDRVENILQNGSDEERALAATNEDIDVVREARHGLAEAEKRQVTQIIEERYDQGNTGRLDSGLNDLGDLGMSSADDLFGDTAPDAKSDFDHASIGAADESAPSEPAPETAETTRPPPRPSLG